MTKKSRLALCIRTAFYGAMPLIMLNSTAALAREVTFDTGIIKTLGLNADLNKYFAKAPRFLPGTHPVNIMVNGNARGTAAVRFNEDGVLCFDNDLLEFAGLMPVPLKAGEACHDIRDDYPKAVINALPNQEAIELYLPPEAINNLTSDARNFQQAAQRDCSTIHCSALITTMVVAIVPAIRRLTWKQVLMLSTGHCAVITS